MPEPQQNKDTSTLTLPLSQLAQIPRASAPAPAASASWTKDYPKTAAATRAVLDALPGAGAVVGGALSTPETAGIGTVAGVALGAGAGRGLRDLIAEGLGLDQPSTPVEKGARIAIDTGESAVAQWLFPSLLEAIKTPGRTVSELLEMLPAKLRPAIPPGLSKAPASILERPAWQTWAAHLPEESSEAAPMTPLSGQTGTSMQPTPILHPPAPYETAIADAKAATAAPAAGAAPASAAATAPSSAGKLVLTADETKLASQWANAKVPDAEIAKRLQQLRELRASGPFANLPSPATVRGSVADRNASGRWGPEE